MAVAAVSATLGISLLQKVLEIVAGRKSFAGDLDKLLLLRQAAKNESVRLSEYADADIAAYGAYLEARRLKNADLAIALRKAIEAPLNAAQSTLSGLDLCADATGLVQGAVRADLETAAILLEGAMRAMLLSVEANLQQLPDGETSSQCAVMAAKGRQKLASILRQISTAEQTARYDAT